MTALHQTVRFDSAGVSCEAWHLPAATDALAGPAGRPCVVMAHGLAGTRDSGLAPYAERLAAAGLDVVAFDYRGFGGSDVAAGQPRQQVSMRGQVEDYHAALRFASGLPGVDPGRLVAWGVSLSGGHVCEVAAARDDIAAVVSLVPLVDGLAAARLAMRNHPAGQLVRSSLTGIRAKVASAAGRAPVMMPVVAAPGEPAAMSLPGCKEAYLAIAGPTWRNEIGAAVTAELGGYRPAKVTDRVRCPVLVQIADFDRLSPPYAAAKAAFRARAEVRHYPCDHFDVFTGRWFEQSADHQVSFLVRHLG